MTLQKLVTSSGGNQVITRINAPVVTTAVVIEENAPEPPHTLVVEVIPVKGISSDSAPRFLVGDPIHQLERSRNAPVRRVPARWSSEKNGNFEFFARDLDIIKDHLERTTQRRNIVKRAHEGALLNAGDRALLGDGLNGHYVYAAPRFKPALPRGRSDLPTVTAPRTVSNDYLMMTAPAGTVQNLDAEAYQRAYGVPKKDLPISNPDKITVPTTTLRPSTFNFTVDDAKGTPNGETPSKSAGKLVFLVAAVFVAWLVLR